jgi:hypothetical protein
MINLYNRETGELIGAISEAQLEFLRVHLEEEGVDDPDYYVDLNTIELLEQEGADASLTTLLRAAVGDEGIEIEFDESG